MRRLIIIPRWAGGPESDFYPWLERALAAQAPLLFDEVRALRLPNPGAPVIADWVRGVREAIGDDPARAAETVLLGHSVGCQAALRALAELPAGTRVAGAVMVAGWFRVDAPWETLRPWMDTPVDLGAARAACPRVVVLLSDDDPFTSDAAANRRAWEERVGAEVRMVPGAKHFNAAEEPAVLEALIERLP
jgi:predicted alpha/beta hydrolase family esterase